MPASIIRGKEAGREILAEIKNETEKIRQTTGKVPGLVTILAGNDPASLSYVSMKIKKAESLGFREIQVNLPYNVKEAELLEIIGRYNNDDDVNGILVQLPLPPHIDEKRVLFAVNPDKDVDGFHPVNMGRLMIGGSCVRFTPCTPAGVLELIRRTGVKTAGAEAVIIGRSNIVGKPLAAMLSQKPVNATVTVLHTASKNIDSHCRQADILVAAAGSPGIVKGDWIKPGACVIDVGITRVGETISPGTGKKCAVLKGDVEYEAAMERAGYITPVPGGVGPMTITMLMKNTLLSLKYSLGIL